MKYLTIEQLDRFVNDGVLVVPNVLSSDEVSNYSQQYHKTLLQYGCNHDQLDNQESIDSLTNLSSTNGSGGILDIFYDSWKLEINENINIYNIFTDLYNYIYSNASLSDIFSHPYGNFNTNEAFMYIDRVCYRLPDKLSLKYAKSKKKPIQRSLTPHLDCCPHNMFNSDKDFSKWRPIQAFVSLTNTLNENEGGFEASLGHHKIFNEWSYNRYNTEITNRPPCVGDFTPIRPIEDKDVINKFKHIPCKAGDLILWDYRIPHANSRYNNSDLVREVVYIGMLPSIELNKLYAREQLRRYKLGLLPCDQWHESKMIQSTNHSFSHLGRYLMTIDEWPSS